MLTTCERLNLCANGQRTMGEISPRRKWLQSCLASHSLSLVCSSLRGVPSVQPSATHLCDYTLVAGLGSRRSGGWWKSGRRGSSGWNIKGEMSMVTAVFTVGSLFIVVAAPEQLAAKSHLLYDAWWALFPRLLRAFRQGEVALWAPLIKSDTHFFWQHPLISLSGAGRLFSAYVCVCVCFQADAHSLTNKTIRQPGWSPQHKNNTC